MIKRYLFAAMTLSCSGAGTADGGGAGGSTSVSGAGGQSTAAFGGVAGTSPSGGVNGAGGTLVTAGSVGFGGRSGGTGGLGPGGASPGSGGMFGTGGMSSTNAGGATATGGAAAGAGGSTAGRSTGCGKAPTLTASTQPVPAGFGAGGRYTIQSGGQARSFIIRLPDNYDPSHPYWLIFGFHWNGGLADDVDSGGTSRYDFSYYGLQKQSGNGAIFVAPQGIGNGWANSGGRDLTFTDDMVALIQTDLCVDTTHVISTGFSYGAGMSYAIACARAQVFHAVVLYEGAPLSGCEGGNDPVGFMALAGLADNITTIGPARAMRDRFVTNNGCTPQNPPEPPPGSLTHVCTSYSGCSSGHPVRWCAHGSGHTPAPVDGSSTLVDGINTWSPPEVWSWLSAF